MARKQEELLLSVADVLLIETATGIEYATASLKSHNISQSVDTSEIRAGRKNAVIATLESNKTITIEIEDVHTNRDWLAIAMDAELVGQTDVDVRALPVKLVVGADNSITLPKTPIEADTKRDGQGAMNLRIYNSQREEVEVETVDGAIITLADTVKEGDIVETSSYRFTAPVADVMEIGNEGAGRSFAMFLEETVFNNDMAVIARKVTYFPRVLPESSFSMEGSSELAEQNMTYTFTVAQAEAETFLGKVYYIDEVQE